jgi:hypothetical protein
MIVAAAMTTIKSTYSIIKTLLNFIIGIAVTPPYGGWVGERL